MEMGHVLTEPYLVPCLSIVLLLLRSIITIVLIGVTDAPRPSFIFVLIAIFHFGDPGPEEVRGTVQGPTGIDTIWDRR
jgi:hypothetical protein